MLKPTVALLFLCLVLSSSAQAAESAAEARFFQEKVAPILVGHCLECHSATEEGGLDLRSKQTAMAGGDSGSVLMPGDSEDSLLFQYVATHEMPPKRPLSDQQVAAIKKWIDDGAFFPERPLHPFAVSTDTRAGFDWWSLQPLQVEEPPVQPQSPAGWQDSAIDRFVYRKLAAQKLTPSGPASPRVLIRRATYDLIGLPPTPAEAEAFLQACERETGAAGQVGEKAYAALIDRLLASPHYGEHARGRPRVRELSDRVSNRLLQPINVTIRPGAEIVVGDLRQALEQTCDEAGLLPAHLIDLSSSFLRIESKSAARKSADVGKLRVAVTLP